MGPHSVRGSEVGIWQTLGMKMANSDVLVMF